MTTQMSREIAAAPALLRSLAAGWQQACEAARAATRDRPRHLALGRGSSGHAAVFYSYLYTLRSGQPVAEFRPWIATQSDPGASWHDATALALSVSGESSDVVHASKWLVEHGAAIVAATNGDAASSTLARISKAHVELAVGPERAVPATKSFLAQLCIAAGMCGYTLERPASEAADCIDVLLAEAAIDELASRLDDARMIVWVARGPALAVASDAALKLQEAAGRISIAYSAAELHHGPIGALTEQDVVLLLNDAQVLADSLRATATVLVGRRIPFVLLGDAKSSDGLPLLRLSLPRERWARSLVFAAAAQRLATALAARAGRNPDAPPGLSKVTHTL